MPVVPCLTVPVVLKTWGKQTTNIEYYSEEEDESIPTVDLGVSNEKSGEWEGGRKGREAGREREGGRQGER